MIRASDDNNMAAFSSLFIHNPVDLLDERTCRVQHVRATAGKFFLHPLWNAVGADDDRLARLGFLGCGNLSHTEL